MEVESGIGTEEQFLATLKVRQKIYKEKAEADKKLKLVNGKLLSYMLANNIDSKQLDVDGEMLSIAKVEPSSIEWKEDKCKAYLEPLGLWDDVVEVITQFNPERIVALVNEGKLTQEQTAEMATIKKIAAYVKVSAVKA